MKLSVTKSGNACGADIKFDLSSELDDRTFAEIEQTLHDNIVVYFRGQQLSSERHIKFSRRFGELEIHVLKKYLLPGYPETDLEHQGRKRRKHRPGGCRLHLAHRCLLPEKAKPVLVAVCQGSAVPGRAHARRYSVHQYHRRLRGV